MKKFMFFSMLMALCFSLHAQQDSRNGSEIPTKGSSSPAAAPKEKDSLDTPKIYRSIFEDTTAQWSFVPRERSGDMFTEPAIPTKFTKEVVIGEYAYKESENTYLKHNPFFLRESKDHAQIYALQNGIEERKVFDLSLKVGDTFYLYSWSSVDKFKSMLIVDSVYYQVHTNGDTLKHVRLSDSIYWLYSNMKYITCLSDSFIHDSIQCAADPWIEFIEGVGPNCGFRNFLEPTWDLLNDYLLCMEKGGELYYKNATNLPCDVKVRYLGEGKNEANQKNIDFVFTISPNPAHQEVEISIKQPNLSNLTMEVLDLSGRCLLRKAIESSTFLLPLEQYTPGLYLIKINTPQGNYARKLVVQ